MGPLLQRHCGALGPVNDQPTHTHTHTRIQYTPSGTNVVLISTPTPSDPHIVTFSEFFSLAGISKCSWLKSEKELQGFSVKAPLTLSSICLRICYVWFYPVCVCVCVWFNLQGIALREDGSSPV